MQTIIAVLFALVFIAVAVFVFKPFAKTPSSTGTQPTGGSGGGGTNKNGQEDAQ